MHTLTDVSKQNAFAALQQAIAERTARVGVIGLGYVGLPLAAVIARADFVTVGFDIDPAKVGFINAGTSYIDAVASADLCRADAKAAPERER